MFSSLGALSFTTAFASVLAATTGGFDDGGSTLVSAMMMFLGNEDAIYILDKAENNAAPINGHPAWGSRWDIKSRKAVVMDIKTNSFCASGMHLPNGSFIALGGNDAVTTAGAAGSLKNPDNTGAWDQLYQDFDGRKSIRIINPCKSTDNLNSPNCLWYDEPTVLAMKKRRWYSAAEPTGEGQVVIIGGFTAGGYINRWLPNVDPANENGGAEPTYEYYPPKDGDAQVLDFVVQTSGLNAYPHTFLMPSGKILLQANLSTTLWDHVNNKEFPLPAMPHGVVRVYPASGATAMLPLTPANNYTPTVLFCGGSAIDDAGWGDYTGPGVDTWTVPASQDCQRLTPEPQDGSAVAYEQDDDMMEPRTMGQFILLPNGKVLLLNGGQKGTAGYSLGTKNTPNLANMPFGPSLAAEPVMTPVIYDPTAPKGSRWSRDGLSASKIPRLYHSSAILLPDASVIVAGSNPNPDVNLTTLYPTEYRADIFYPSYFSAKVRPAPTNVPSTLSYGGPGFDIILPSSSYEGAANDAADATTVSILRSGFTTHAMNMGQRYMQLNNTFTVNKNGSITLHVAQLPPNPNLFQPGPALLFVNIKGIPSTGKYLIVGNGQIGTQPTASATVLPASAHFDAAAGGGTSDGSTADSGSKKSNLGMVIGGIVGGLAILALLGVAVGVFLARKKRAAALHEKSTYPMDGLKPMGMAGPGGMHYSRASNATESTVFAPLAPGGKGLEGYNDAWDSSTANLQAPYAPYRDDGASSMRQSRASSMRQSQAYSDYYDPYGQQPMMPHDTYGQPRSGSVGPGSGSASPVQRGQSQHYDELPTGSTTDLPGTQHQPPRGGQFR